jgi:hypothetical protein
MHLRTRSARLAAQRADSQAGDSGAASLIAHYSALSGRSLAAHKGGTSSALGRVTRCHRLDCHNCSRRHRRRQRPRTSPRDPSLRVGRGKRMPSSRSPGEGRCSVWLWGGRIDHCCLRRRRPGSPSCAAGQRHRTSLRCVPRSTQGKEDSNNHLRYRWGQACRQTIGTTSRTCLQYWVAIHNPATCCEKTSSVHP